MLEIDPAKHVEDQLLGIQERLLAELRTQQGAMWKEVQGELHLPHHEMPVWIVLYADSDPVEAHRAFLKIARPYLEQLGALAVPRCWMDDLHNVDKPRVKVTVSYTILVRSAAEKDTLRQAHAALDAGDAAHQAEGLEVMDDFPNVQHSGKSFVLTSLDSTRP